MKYVQSKTWAPNTFKAISSQWRAFKIFSGLAGITHLPIPAYVICFLAIWLPSTGRVKSRGSPAQYVSAIRTVHKMLRLEEVPTPSQGNLALCKLSSDHSSDAIQEYAFIPGEIRLNISSKVNASLAAAIALRYTGARPSRRASRK